MKIIYESAAFFAFGVYGFYIENAKGRKLYIGQTSRYFKKRWREHILSFKKLICNRKIKEFITPDSIITFFVIKICGNKEQAIKWEKRYIKEMQPELNVKMK